MAFVDKFNKEGNENFQASIISEKTTIKGDLEVGSSLLIYGKIFGDIISSGVVTVSGDGFVKGKIVADTIVVSGLCEGVVDANIVDIVNKGVIDGEVSCEHLIIEKGGFLQGISKKRVKRVEEKEVKVIENKDKKNKQTKTK
jgi:cytoskeletal protein CcmA (bactofilin family)